MHKELFVFNSIVIDYNCFYYFCSSSPKSRISTNKPTFSVGTPPGSPCDRTLLDISDETLTSPQTSPVKSIKTTQRRSWSQSPSPTNLARTPSPLTRELTTPPPLIRKVSSSTKVSTPPSLEPVIDSGENNHNEKKRSTLRQVETYSPLSRRQTTVRPKRERPRRTTISNAMDPLSELEKSKKTVPYINLYSANKTSPKDFSLVEGASNVFQGNLNFKVDIRKTRSSPALISEAVKNIPIKSPQENIMNSNLAVLLKQLAQENLQPNILATLPSPSFKLMNSPPSPILFTGEYSPPPGVFQSSPASWQDKIYMRKRLYSQGNNDGGHHIANFNESASNNVEQRRTSEHSLSLSSLDKPKVRSCPENVNTSIDISQMFPIQERLSFALKPDLSLDPIPLHKPPELCDEVFLSKEHLIAMEEIEFLSRFSEAILHLTTDMKLSSYVSDLILNKKMIQSHILPSSDGSKCFKILFTLEALRIASYALKFSQSYRKKGTLEPTGALQKGIVFNVFGIL